MTAYRKQTIVVDAVQFQQTPAGEPLHFSDDPDWLATALETGTIKTAPGDDDPARAIAITVFGPVIVNVTDWIAHRQTSDTDWTIQVFSDTDFQAAYEAIDTTTAATK